MSRRNEWRTVLGAEVRRWSSIPYDQLILELRAPAVYEVELDSKMYQVEVEILSETDRWVQVIVAVDDGTLPASIVPVTDVFICQKERSP